MGERSRIEWTDATWNPLTGCDEVSPGCDNCYARTLAERFRGTAGHYYEHGFNLVIRPAKLAEPLRWARPRMVFVNSMSDLFHTAVAERFVAEVFAVMALTPHHTYQVLTKRHARMRSLLNSTEFQQTVGHAVVELARRHRMPEPAGALCWPLPNLWLGVSVETQQWADIRVPALLGTPAAVRFLSCEPLLGPVLLCSCDGAAYTVRRHPFLENPGCPLHGHNRIDWVIVGGESGGHARPMHPSWARRLRDQCTATGVPFLFKQWGEWAPFTSPGDPGEVWHQFPDRTLARRIGKIQAGRELDGRTWDQYPTPAAALDQA